jgi:Holliday junction resolvasome RuvABC endonuclease subunit
MRVLAIDPGSHQTGYAYRDNNGNEVSGVLKASKSASFNMRLDILARGLRALLNSVPKGFDLAIMETPDFFAKNKRRGYTTGRDKSTQALFILSRATGGLMLVLIEGGIDVREIAASKWKGRLTKAQAMAITGKTNDNEADAICLLRWYEVIGKNL